MTPRPELVEMAAEFMWWLVDRENGAALDPKVAHAKLASLLQSAVEGETERCAKVVEGWGYRGTGKIAYEAIAAALRSTGAGKG